MEFVRATDSDRGDPPPKHGMYLMDNLMDPLKKLNFIVNIGFKSKLKTKLAK